MCLFVHLAKLLLSIEIKVLASFIILASVALPVIMYRILKQFVVH